AARQYQGHYCEGWESRRHRVALSGLAYLDAQRPALGRHSRWRKLRCAAAELRQHHRGLAATLRCRLSSGTMGASIASIHEVRIYRPFIDGLRAIAILTVVGSHISLPGFSGGFVGVDIFFVIS